MAIFVSSMDPIVVSFGNNENPTCTESIGLKISSTQNKANFVSIYMITPFQNPPLIALPTMTKLKVILNTEKYYAETSRGRFTFQLSPNHLPVLNHCTISPENVRNLLFSIVPHRTAILIKIRYIRF